MKVTSRILTALTICFFSFQTTHAATHNKSEKKSAKEETTKSNEQAHWVKGATMDNFVMPVNPMQKPVKAPLV